MKEALSSGSTLEMSVANIKQSWELTVAVLKAFKEEGIDLDVDLKKFSFRQLLEKNTDKILAGIMSVVCSEDVLNKILACASTAIYTRNNLSQKVSLEVFEDEDCRQDMVEVLTQIAIRNIKPFFPKALFKSGQTKGQV